MDELELLKELGGEIDPVDPEARSRARRLLEERIRSTGPSVGSPPIPRRPRTMILAAALITALVVVIAALQAMLPPGSGGPDLARAALGDLARVAGSTEAMVLLPGDYLYVRSQGFVMQTRTDASSRDSWAFLVFETREKWLSPDGSGRILVRYGEARFPSEADRAAWRSAGSPPLLPPGSHKNFRFGPGELAPRDLGSLPKDPSSLAALISSGGVTEGSDDVTIDVTNDSLGVIAGLLGDVPTSPELRSTVFLATAELHGVESLGEVTDPSGRAGIGIAIVESGVRTELIFDSTTSELLSTSVVRVDAEGSPTQVLSELIYQVRAVVTSTHTRPK